MDMLYDSHNPLFISESSDRDVENTKQNFLCMFTDFNRRSIINISSKCIKMLLNWLYLYVSVDMLFVYVGI